jgi:malonyl CoA-acyl carrier protein transacylase
MLDSSEKLEQLSSSQRLLLALKEARAKLEAVDRSKSEPIAIIGMSCRFPGGANDPEAFWQLLHNGVDAIASVPSQRWDVDNYYDPDPDASGKIYTRSGGFLQQVDEFDPQFFGISPREAISLDPQQRLLLEVSWEALENAGIAADRLAGSKTGIFVGIGQNDYAQLHLNSGDHTNINAYDGTGNGFCFASGRLSYVLGLQGPNMAVDTACSSSLVAVHLACQSLRAGECNLALVGGVQLILSPEVTIFLSRTHALSPDGRCKTFDAAADGFGRGEGCGVLVLKWLSDAVADKDNILALIRGSAVNHDGPSSGLTVPNKLAQQALIREALRSAKVEPSQVSYVEAHGTGTPLGDPIEIEALKAVLGEERSPLQPLIIGSVKTNIGHLEAAAGVAGLIKVILALQHQEIPPHLHFKQPNPYINWNELPVVVPTKSMPWPCGTQQRIAGVSSFGMSGTNAHIVLEEAPRSGSAPALVERPLHLLALSAKTEPALKQLVDRYQNHLKIDANLALGDICYSANSGRSHFDRRLSVMASSTVELLEKLASFTSGQEVPGVNAAQMQRTNRPKIAFLFTGQGSQYIGMGRQLYDTQPTFRAALDKCAEILQPYLEKPLLEVLYPQKGTCSPIDETVYTQPALFAIEYALYHLWESWGIKPDAVMGHSVGEYVAATIAGVLSLEDGLKLIASRGRLMQALPPDGEMMAVLADEATIREAIQPYSQEVAIAAINGPKNIVISGKCQSVGAIRAALEAKGVKTKNLQVSHAFHSPLMEPMLEEFERVAAEVTYSEPLISLISNVTGKLATAEIGTPQYWCRHVRQPVQFAASMETLAQQGYELFVEIGAKPTLLGMARSILESKRISEPPRSLKGEQHRIRNSEFQIPNSEFFVWLPSLRPGCEDWQQMLESLAQLYVRGVSVDWMGFDRDYARRRVVLPTYPFVRQRCWLEETHNDRAPVESLSQETVSIPLVNLLQQGDTQQLAAQIESAAELSTEEAKFVPKLLAILIKQYRQQLTSATVQDWLYEVQWQPKPRQETTLPMSSPEAGTWLIFADKKGIGQSLARLLQAQGQDCLLVYAGEDYQAKAPDIWQLNPLCSEDFLRLFQEISELKKPPLRKVVYLWTLDTPLATELTPSTLERSQVLGCGSALHLVQAIVSQSRAFFPRLWLITQGAVSVDSSLPGVAQATLWGLGKVIASEHRELWGGAIDLAPEADEVRSDAATTLLAEFADSQGEDQIAFRQGQRYVARLTRSREQTATKLSFFEDGTYLIAGGLGALGLQVARWMVDRGARSLVLTGRRSPSKEAQETLERLQQLGAKVLVAQVDVSQDRKMVELLEKIEAVLPPLRGIVHAAGTLDDGILLQQNWESFERVMAAKVKGTWILHELTEKISLDFFVMFSSTAVLLGSPGQGNYAAANAFMDALAHYRQGLGLPALSVNWGPWDSVGMAASLGSHDRARMGDRGIKSIQPEQGLQVLENLLARDAAQVGVLSADWSKFSQLFGPGQIPPFLELLAQTALSTAAEQQNDFFKELEATPVGDRRNLIIARVRSLVAKVMGLASEEIDLEQSLSDIGMDSLMAMELRNHLQTSLGRTIPATLAYDYPTVEALGDYLATELLGLNASTQAEDESQEEVTNSDLDLLSDSEAEALLLDKLDSMRY